MASIQKLKGPHGTVYKITVSAGTDATGRRVRHYKRFTPPPGMTAREALKAAQRLAYELETGADAGLQVSDRQTFGDYARRVLEIRSDQRMEGALKPATIDLYARVLRRVEPLLGGVQLRQLTSQKISKAYAALTADGLAPGTVRAHHTTVSSILRQAVKDRILQVNPAATATLPKRAAAEKVPFTQEELAAIRAEAGRSMSLSWRVMLDVFMTTGMRRGEVAGLTWGAIDWERSQLEVVRTVNRTRIHGTYVGTPKTARSRRFVALPPAVLRELRELRRDQAERQLLLGDRWVASDFVFTALEGGVMNPENINVRFRQLGQRVGIRVNPHKFRHTAATLLISGGVDVVSVSAQLGHSNVTTTLNVYSHALEEAKRRNASILGGVLEAASGDSLATTKVKRR